MVAANYTYKNLFKWEVAVFQNNDTTGASAMTRGNVRGPLGRQPCSSRAWLRASGSRRSRT